MFRRYRLTFLSLLLIAGTQAYVQAQQAPPREITIEEKLARAQSYARSCDNDLGQKRAEYAVLEGAVEMRNQEFNKMKAELEALKKAHPAPATEKK